MIDDPPLSEEADHVILAIALPPVATTLVGATGTTAGVALIGNDSSE